MTLVQLLLGLINLGSTSAFTAFVSVGVQALALAYSIPIAISLLNKREQVLKARWNLGRIAGPIVNVIALLWISFELVLFSMPTALPVTPASMNYASVVLVGFGAIAAVWYAVHSRKCEFEIRRVEKMFCRCRLLTLRQPITVRRLLKVCDGFRDERQRLWRGSCGEVWYCGEEFWISEYNSIVTLTITHMGVWPCPYCIICFL